MKKRRRNVMFNNSNVKKSKPVDGLPESILKNLRKNGENV